MSNETELEKCSIYKRNGSICTITCRLGLWKVTGKYDLALINKAEDHFQQHKANGDYKKILGQ